MPLHATVSPLHLCRISTAARFRAHSVCLSAHEAVLCRLDRFLHCVDEPAVRPRWRPVCHESVIQLHNLCGMVPLVHSHHHVNQVLRFLMFSAAPAAVVVITSSTLLILACWLVFASCSVFSFQLLPQRALLSSGHGSTPLLPTFRISSLRISWMPYP